MVALEGVSMGLYSHFESSVSLTEQISTLSAEVAQCLKEGVWDEADTTVTAQLMEFLAQGGHWNQVANIASQALSGNMSRDWEGFFYQYWLTAQCRLEDYSSVEVISQHILDSLPEKDEEEQHRLAAVCMLGYCFLGKWETVKKLSFRIKEYISNNENNRIQASYLTCKMLSPNRKTRTKAIVDFEELQTKNKTELNYLDLVLWYEAALENDEYEALVSAIKELNRKYPYSEESYWCSIRNSALEGAWDEVLFDVETLLKINNKNEDAILARAIALFKMGDIQSSVDYLEANRNEETNNDLDYIHLLGVFYSRLYQRYNRKHDFNQACKHLGESLKWLKALNFDESHVHFLLHEIKAGIGEEVSLSTRSEDRRKGYWVALCDQDLLATLFVGKNVYVPVPEEINPGDMVFLSRTTDLESDGLFESINDLEAMVEVAGPIVPAHNQQKKRVAHLMEPVFFDPVSVVCCEPPELSLNESGAANFDITGFLKFYFVDRDTVDRILTEVERLQPDSQISRDILQAI